MHAAKAEIEARLASELDRNNIEGAIRIIQSYLLSLDVDVFATAADDLFEEVESIKRYIENFLKTVSPVREVKSLILQLDEVDLGSDNWVFWPATSSECIDPNDSDEAYDDFEEGIQGPEGYSPCNLQGFNRMKVAFDWYRHLTSAEKQVGNRKVAKEFAYELVLLRFYQLLRMICDDMRETGRIPADLCIFASEYGGDFFYCVTPENLPTDPV